MRNRCVIPYYYRALLLCVAMMMVSLTRAQSIFQMDDSMQRAMQCVYEFRYAAAKTLVQQERKQYPNNAACDFVEATLAAFQANFNDDSRYYDQFRQQFEQFEDALEKLPKTSPWRNHLNAQLYLQIAFADLKYESYYSAFKALRSANKLLNANKKITPNFLPDLLPAGILNVVVSAIPDNIRWIAEMFGLEGDYEGGMKNMEKVLRETSQNGEYQWLQMQSLIFVAMVQMSLGDNPEQNQRVEKILQERLEKIKNSPLLMNTLATLLVKTGDNDGAILLLLQILQQPQSKEYPILYYQLGRCRLQRGDSEAVNSFRSYLAHRQSDKLVKSTYRQMAWYYFLQDDQSHYVENMANAARLGTAKSEADKDALREAKSGVLPQKTLLKARLLFDGGYFDQALNVLQNCDNQLFTKQEQLEYYYRLGRVYHGLRNYSQAATYYQKTLNQAAGSTDYIVANSALMLGNVYELQKKYDLAIRYYKECQSIKSDIYEQSIHQKAKVGQNRCQGELKKK